MRHFTLLGLALLLSAGARAQVIFESGFEDWNGGLPTDWYGSKSNLPQSGVEQVTSDVHGGASAVRLIKASTGHQRFTTQPLSVTANQEYEVRFWVRGEGQIRVGLYDGRPTGSGYAPYTSWNTITGNTWQQVTATITAAVDAADAEFILSVQSTAAPEHLVVDDATITAQAVVNPTPASIAEIQETTAPDGASPLNGTTVVTQGTVSALLANGFFLQDGTGPWSGIFVFGSPGALQIGDQITITGTVTEFNGQTQIASVLNIVTLTSGNPVPATVVSTLNAGTEPYESVFVRVVGASCTAQGSFGQFTLNDGSGPVLVDDVIYAHPFSVGQVYNVQGPMQYAFSEWRILPRFAADVELAIGMPEAGTRAFTVFPNPAADAIRIHAPLNGRTEYALLDAAGRAVMSGTLTRDVLGLGEVAPGRYTLLLRGTDGARYANVVLER